MSISSETELATSAIEDAGRFVAALGEDGICPTAAFWYYSTTYERWRLAIVVEGLNVDGGIIRCYTRVLDTLNKLTPETALTATDITLQDEHSPLVDVVRKTCRSKVRKLNLDGSVGHMYVGRSVFMEFVGGIYAYRL